MLILDGIRCKIEKQTLCEEPISPEFRLGLSYTDWEEVISSTRFRNLVVLLRAQFLQL